MFARNASIHLKFDMLSNYTRTFDKYILPVLRKQHGFKDEIRVMGPGGADVTAISLWESRTDAEAYGANTYPAMLRKMARFIKGTPQVDTFEVVASNLHRIAAQAA